jgi:cytoskeletal protein CcmA (bactofilin family)
MAEDRKPPQFPSELARRVVGLPSSGHQDGLHGEGNKKLVVGRDISLSGEITDCDVLVVEGKVKASLRDSRRFEISETGAFEGSVEIDVAEIKGSFEGDLLVRGRLIVRRTGSVTGRIRYAELEIERGGQISGDIQVMAESETAALPGPENIAGYTQPTVVEDTAALDRESDLRA